MAMVGNGNGKNGNGGPTPTTPVGMLASISERIVRVLPPAFLLLVILNVAFLAVTGWVFQHGAEARNILLTKIIENCLLNRTPQ